MLNYYLLVVIMTVYAIEKFHSSPSEAGLASSIFVIGALVSRVFSGMWIELTGRKKMLVTGAVSCFFLTLLYFSVNNILFLLFIRFAHGVAYGAASTAIGTVISDIIPKSRRGEGLGYYMLSITMASAIGPFLGMFIIRSSGFGLIFWFCAASTLLSFVLVAFMNVPEIELTGEQVKSMRKFRISNFLERNVVPISLVCAVIYFCYSSVLSFLSPYAKEIHLENAAGFFFIVYSASILVSRPFTGRLFDSKGENIIMYPAFLLFMAGMVLLSLTKSGVVLLSAAAFLGFGVGIIQSCGLAVAVKMAPQQKLGLANSTFYIFLDLGVGIGPVVLGTLVPFSGYSGMYMSMVFVTLASAVLYYFLHGRNYSKV
jgi:MFS family permease